MTLFTGSGVALITPFNDDHSINFEKLKELIQWHIEAGTDALIICGTTGEASTMDDTEHLSCIEAAVDFAAKRVPVIAGTGSNDTKHGVQLSKEAEKLGVDGLLQVTPYYNKTTQRGLLAHFGTIANQVDIPIILYNVPGRTGMNIAPETVKELSKFENIVALKEASGNIAQVIQTAALTQGDIDLYSGNDDQVVPLLSLGGKGVISVVANILPKETHDMVQSFFDGQVQKSLNLQFSMLDVINNLFTETNPIPIKEAMNLLGYQVGPCRLPLYEMGQTNRQNLINALSAYGMEVHQ